MLLETLMSDLDLINPENLFEGGFFESLGEQLSETYLSNETTLDDALSVIDDSINETNISFIDRMRSE